MLVVNYKLFHTGGPYEIETSQLICSANQWTSQRRIRAAAASMMERFVIIVNGFQPLTIITKRSILDVAAAVDPPLLVSK